MLSGFRQTSVWDFLFRWSRRSFQSARLVLKRYLPVSCSSRMPRVLVRVCRRRRIVCSVCSDRSLHKAQWRQISQFYLFTSVSRFSTLSRAFPSLSLGSFRRKNRPGAMSPNVYSSEWVETEKSHRTIQGRGQTQGKDRSDRPLLFSLLIPKELLFVRGFWSGFALNSSCCIVERRRKTMERRGERAARRRRRHILEACEKRLWSIWLRWQVPSGVTQKDFWCFRWEFS